MTAKRAATLRDLTDACALDTGSLTTKHAQLLTSALETSRTVIRESLRRPDTTDAPAFPATVAA